MADPKPTDAIQTGIRLQRRYLDKAEALIPYVRSTSPVGHTTRSDVLRIAIDIGLATLETREERATRGD